MKILVYCWGSIILRKYNTSIPKQDRWDAVSHYTKLLASLALRKKYPFSDFFMAAPLCILTEYGDLFRKSPYSPRMRENFGHGHLSRSAKMHL